jgi:N-hydroxyarylamine O-acetyltransferase
MNVDAYLSRISYNGSRIPNAQTLRELQHAHLQTVPFENLDIHLGQSIKLDQNALFEKIVVRRRGGFCYELNGLFGGLLRALGFDVTMLSAGVARPDGSFGPDFDHLTLMVQAPAEAPTHHLQSSALQPAIYIADVGFGDSPLAPLRLDDAAEQQQEGRAYRFDRDGEVITLLRRTDDAWSPEYRFTLQPHQHAEYADMCRYHQTSPASKFKQKRLVTLVTPHGRVTLSDLRLIVTEDGVRKEHLISQAYYGSVLRERFGIDLELNTIA